MKTRLKNFAKINYPIDYEMQPKETLNALRRKCKRGLLNAEKDGRIWYVIGDGSFDQPMKNDNPLIA